MYSNTPKKDVYKKSVISTRTPKLHKVIIAYVVTHPYLNHLLNFNSGIGWSS